MHKTSKYFNSLHYNILGANLVNVTLIFLGNGHKYKDKYRQTPPAQTLSELKVENDPEDLNLNSLGMITKYYPKTANNFLLISLRTNI